MELERLETLKDSEKSKIYLVFDIDNRRMLVEKHLRGNLPIYQRLMNLSHPYLPKLYEVRSGPEETVVVEEYIEGCSIVAAHPTERQLRKWLLELCEVLHHLHQNQIVHRDIKPSNLLIGADGHIRLIDFDAAREEKPQAESDTRLIGTRGYAPPEQYGFAQTDGRADIYAMGVTFRELLGKAALAAYSEMLYSFGAETSLSVCLADHMGCPGCTGAAVCAATAVLCAGIPDCSVIWLCGVELRNRYRLPGSIGNYFEFPQGIGLSGY